LAGTSNLPQIIEDRRQSEAHDFETAQHIDKQITDVSSTINALQNVTKLEATTPRSFDAT